MRKSHNFNHNRGIKMGQAKLKGTKEERIAQATSPRAMLVRKNSSRYDDLSKAGVNAGYHFQYIIAIYRPTKTNQVYVANAYIDTESNPGNLQISILSAPDESVKNWLIEHEEDLNKIAVHIIKQVTTHSAASTPPEL